MIDQLLALAAAVTLSSQLQPLLDTTCARSTADQCQQLSEALRSSPTLRSQLDELVKGGLLTSIAIVKKEDAPKVRNMQFGASFVDGSMILTDQFLIATKNNHLYDVRSQDDIYPNNLVFALGHLAYNASSAKAIQESQDEIRRGLKAASKGPPYDATQSLALWTRLHLENEATAEIQGWNDMIDAAVQGNNGVTLSLKQVGTLLMNFRYKAAFSKALQGSDQQSLFSKDGTIAVDKHSVDALTGVLGTLQVIDIQPD